MRFNPLLLGGTRQIQDGPILFIDEVLQWCRRKKKHALIFKVDFEKAFDSVRWDFVDDVLNKFGFGERWRTWIQSLSQTSRRSIPCPTVVLRLGHRESKWGHFIDDMACCIWQLESREMAEKRARNLDPKIMPPRRALVARRAPIARRAPSARTANNPARNASTTTDVPMSAAAINQLIKT
ncbi:RNA-directed DNA polymerase, eukaryota, reverse transcriptase zinc-binding domain protein [Tanacetum coccineum]|uniref:RNA-directed DNA polymerase, eukaryota, reverse transcriptase zinc-binding domain protein n=1 Tax=Tanacetum coccineum TaxID=301880 RepID=A0ABQ5ENE0_9ASTR